MMKASSLLVWRNIVLTTLSLTIADPSAAQSPSLVSRFVGDWRGVAASRPDSGPPVNVSIRIRPLGDSLQVALSIPDSRLVRLTIPSPYGDSSYLRLRNDSLYFEFTPDIGLGVIARMVPPDSERIVFVGAIRGGRLEGRLRITRYESSIALDRVQEDDGAEEPAVRFFSTGDSLALHGKLVLPHSAPPYPAAIFVTGSDPDTRDAWYVEARALAARGIASLLYDKRGVAESVGASHDLVSWDDLAGDVEGGVRYLRSRTDLIDATRIGLIGQSQGTWIIAKVAARDPRIAFLVSISGSGMSAAEQETYRSGALMSLDGFSDSDTGRARAFQREKFAVARTGLGWERLDSLMKQLRADSVKWFPGYGTGAATRTLAGLRLFGVLQFNYDPRRDLEQITSPVLVIMGEQDAVFPPAIVIERMQQALTRAGNTDVSARMLPLTSHGMMVTQTVNGQPFRKVISPRFLSELIEWVATRAR